MNFPDCIVSRRKLNKWVLLGLPPSGKLRKKVVLVLYAEPPALAKASSYDTDVIFFTLTFFPAV